MDRSVDSIGSCSLDVDAESTDFSDTSGSLNLPTPSSAKDITREFTSRIKERCQITQINCQQTTTILDPCSGKISTIIGSVETPISSPVKKPSYLNLACCVNGYSNLTTYDSKLRQNINKSREVSPIRPSLNTLQYCKASGNFLAPPSLTVNVSPSRESIMENRNYLQDGQGIDTIDNAATGKYFKSTKYISATIKTTKEIQQTETISSKSFIQQRVERLYGPGALAQGFYSPKKSRSNGSSVLCERTSNTQNTLSNSSSKTMTSCIVQDDYNSSSLSLDNDQSSTESLKNLKNCEDLPVLRHLRPEFRAQLPILSPKKSQTKLLIVESSPVLVNGKSSHMNGEGDEDEKSFYSLDKNYQQPPPAVVVVRRTEEDARNRIGDHQVLVNIQTDSENRKEVVFNTNTITSAIDDIKIGLDETAQTAGHYNINNNNNKVKQLNKNTDNTIIRMLPATEEVDKAAITTGNNIITSNKCQASQSTTPMMDSKSSEENSSHPPQRDGNYFLQICQKEQERLISLAVRAEEEIESLSNTDVTDEIMGYLRSAAGKARLLASKKMKQFEGLCYNNLNQLPDEKFRTTCEDLQGFWDMVMLQVDHVNLLYDELDTLKKNGWKKPTQTTPPIAPQGSKLTRRPNPVKVSSNSNASNTGTTTKSKITNGASSKKSSASDVAAQKREAQRKQLMELKRKNKMAISAEQQQQQNPSNTVEIFVNEPSCS